MVKEDHRAEVAVVVLGGDVGEEGGAHGDAAGGRLERVEVLRPEVARAVGARVGAVEVAVVEVVVE